MPENTAIRVDLAEDSWLAGIVGCSVFRVTPSSQGEATLADLPEQVFAYTKVGADEVWAVEKLTGEGFRLVDTMVTLERRAGPCKPPAEGLRLARAADEDAVAAMAATAFRYNRFQVDPRFPKAFARAIKESWARNFFAGRRGTHMVVAEKDGRAIGFNLLIAHPERVVIDLIAVAPEHQGEGIGADLVRFAIAEVAGERPILVGTQLINTPSLRLYVRLGFCPVGAEHILHLTRCPRWA